MKVILLDTVANLGSVGTEVEVKNGYGRNYLIPQKLAVRATAATRAEFEARRKELEAKAQAKLEEAQALAAKIAELGEITLLVSAGAEGRLFGSVANRDVAEALSALINVEVARSAIRVPGGVIRELGAHTVVVHLHSAVNQELTVNVTAG